MHFADLARNVVRRNPELIVAIGSNNLVLDFKAATTTIPIVGAMAVPVETRIVASLARPSGNITGVAVDVGREQWEKRVQLSQQLVPQATKFNFLQTRAARNRLSIATSAGIKLVGPALDRPTDETEYRRVFAALAEDGAEGVVVSDEEDATRSGNLAKFTAMRRASSRVRRCAAGASFHAHPRNRRSERLSVAVADAARTGGAPMLMTVEEM